jgi:hypothetical protein
MVPVGKVACIGFIAAVFKAVVFLDRSGVGQLHRKARFL